MAYFQEITITILGIILCCLFLIVDWIIYLRLGMSPIFGSLKQREYEDKINVFAIAISWHILIFSAIAFGILKLSGFIKGYFSFKTFLITALSAAIVGNLVSRIILKVRLKKPEVKKDKYDFF